MKDGKFENFFAYREGRGADVGQLNLMNDIKIILQKMSRSSSSSSDTSRPNTTVVSEFQPILPCEHRRSKMRATHVRIRHHRMWDSCVFQYITHDSALVTWHCGECNRRSFQTFEFAMGGKTDRWGRYLRHQSKERHHDVNVDEADVHCEYMLMCGTGHYNLFSYNCKHWAEEFVINIWYPSFLSARLLRLYILNCRKSKINAPRQNRIFAANGKRMIIWHSVGRKNPILAWAAKSGRKSRGLPISVTGVW